MASWSHKGAFQSPFTSFIHCEEKITWAAQKVHGITPEDLKEAPPLFSLWPTLKSHLSEGPVVAHGHGTEKRFLRAFPGHPFGPWVDTLQLARAAWPELPSYSLGNLCEAKKIGGFESLCEGRKWHDALYDALASLAILEHIIKEFSLEDSPLQFLIKPDTSQWHRLHH